MLIRRECAADHEAVAAVHRAAFAAGSAGRAEVVEVELLAALRAGPWWIPELSLVALAEGAVTGHVVATRGSLDEAPALGLGPVGVAPAAQGGGVGSALLHAVLGAAEALGETHVVLLGEPRFSGRFGFVAASELGIASPDPAWGTYFQARRLAGPRRGGAFRYAPPFEEL